ncbi:MAG: MFS transporter [Rhodospirillaceae bacterium]|nr:MFS transporter [Rhodospirillaceae bacterium]MBT5516097.1 MFS transporter [Rhodospirillaceae bacterium]MBT6606987.1 MFS transporter [Rhodospirillaceae bacterium]MBT6882750.1 MFS transporter [Rhodospirillaceae bacterium]MBT7511312.1 MFS transporter [Rhodospirillaceae bacterium]
MIAAFERFTGMEWRGQGPAVVVAGGHAATHWITGTLYVLVPFITKDLGLSYTQAGGLISVFYTASFAANAGSGAVVDITGRRVLIMALSLLIGAVALMGAGFAQSIWLLVGMVIIIGLTNNIWHPAAISYLSRLYPQNKGYVLSVHTLGASFGDMLAPVSAGALLVWMGWQGTATVSALPVFLVAAVIALSLRRSSVGAAESSETSANAMSFRAYLDGLADLIKNRVVLSLCLMSAFRSMAQNGLFLFLPLFMVDVLGFGSVLLGIALMSMQIGGIFAGPLAGAVSDRMGRRPIMVAGMAGTTLAILGLTMVENPTAFIAAMAALGFALFAVRPVIHSWVMDLTPAGMGGSAVSVLFGTQSALSALVPVAGGYIADLWGLKIVFYLLAGTVLIATLMAALIADKPRG